VAERVFFSGMAVVGGILVFVFRQHIAAHFIDQKRRHPWLSTWPFDERISPWVVGACGLMFVLSGVASLTLG
jgi:hypothetical protein